MRDDLKRRRFGLATALVVVGAVLTYLAVGGVGESLVYYWSPSELNAAGPDAVGTSVRLGGLVAPGTVRRDSDGQTLFFEVTDGTQSVPVMARTVPPAMFREGIGVVVEGSMTSSGEFETQRLMVKHDNEYQAPGEGEEAELDDLVKSMQFEEDS